jgi:hypothetical protein
VKSYVIDVNTPRTPERAPTAQVGQTGVIIVILRKRIPYKATRFNVSRVSADSGQMITSLFG